MTNRKSCGLSTDTNMNDLDYRRRSLGQFETFLPPLPRVIYHVLTTIDLHNTRTVSKAYMTCNFNCRIETEGLLKVTGSYVHRKRGNRSETVQDRNVVTTDH